MRILLAEDEKELSSALTAILKHNNYTVDPVYNGQDALDYALSGEYDGIILDIMMPKLNGLEALKKIREAGNKTPVMLLTAKVELDDKVMGLDTGADDYLTKPFASRELLARIRAMTRRGCEFSPNILKIGNLSLNRANYEMDAEGEPVRLANKEFQMMESLMSAPNQLLSSERLMEKIWGWSSESEINVVWVCISGLRKKLSSIGANVNIKAVRGSGYTLEEQNG